MWDGVCLVDSFWNCPPKWKSTVFRSFLTRPDISSIVHSFYQQQMPRCDQVGVSTARGVPTDFSPAISLLWIITFGEMLFWSFLTNSQDTGETLRFVVSNKNNNLTFGHSLASISTRYFVLSAFQITSFTSTLAKHQTLIIAASQRYLIAHNYPDQG